MDGHTRNWNRSSPFIASNWQTFANAIGSITINCWHTYREKPTEKEGQRLDSQFDSLFTTETGYHDLDQRIAKTRIKKTALLLVLQHPELPLHNNASELAVRQRVRKRDVSFAPRTQLGLHAWDTFMTLADTARKLGISFYAYIRDRVSATNQIPPMSLLVTKRARELNLGWSWDCATLPPSY